MAEARRQTLQEWGQAAAAVVYERSMCLGQYNPRRKLAEATAHRRLKRRGWRHAAAEWIGQALGLRPKRLKFAPLVSPYKSGPQLTVKVASGRKPTAVENLQMAQAALADNLEYDYVIYTDGSAMAGGTDAGAGIVVTRGRMDTPDVIEQWAKPVGGLASSYQAKMVAICEALGRIRD